MNTNAYVWIQKLSAVRNVVRAIPLSTTWIGIGVCVWMEKLYAEISLEYTQTGMCGWRNLQL